jgi:hypothetical protein
LKIIFIFFNFQFYSITSACKAKICNEYVSILHYKGQKHVNYDRYKLFIARFGRFHSTEEETKLNNYKKMFSPEKKSHLNFKTLVIPAIKQTENFFQTRYLEVRFYFLLLLKKLKTFKPKII